MNGTLSNGGLSPEAAILLSQQNGNNQGNWMNGLAPLLMGGVLPGLLGGNRGFNNLGNNGVPGYGYAGNSSDTAIKTDVLLQPLITSLSDQINTLSGTVNSNAMNDTINDGLNGIQTSIAGVNSNLNGTSRDTLITLGGISSSIQTTGLTTSNLINNATNVVNSNLANGFNSISSDINQQTIGQLNSANQLNTTLLQATNSTDNLINNTANQIIASQNTSAAQNAANFAQTQYQQQTGFCGIANEIAKCCCEIKGTIKDDGSATRALINDLNVQNLRDQLNDSKNQISDLNQTGALFVNNAAQTQTILQHLIPFFSNQGSVQPVPPVVVNISDTLLNRNNNTNTQTCGNPGNSRAA